MLSPVVSAILQNGIFQLAGARFDSTLLNGRSDQSHLNNDLSQVQKSASVPEIVETAKTFSASDEPKDFQRYWRPDPPD